MAFLVKEFYSQLQSSDQRIQNSPNKYRNLNFSFRIFQTAAEFFKNKILELQARKLSKKSDEILKITLIWWPYALYQDKHCSFLNFQVLARFMVLVNLVLPIFSILFIQTGNSSSLNICLGRGYLNFLPNQAQFCAADNPYKNCVCWVWLTILSIGNSKFQINKLA